jgi:hypothetical protein
LISSTFWLWLFCFSLNDASLIFSQTLFQILHHRPRHPYPPYLLFRINSVVVFSIQFWLFVPPLSSTFEVFLIQSFFALPALLWPLQVL